jgi:hypothetical protein
MCLKNEIVCHIITIKWQKRKNLQVKKFNNNNFIHFYYNIHKIILDINNTFLDKTMLILAKSKPWDGKTKPCLDKNKSQME